VNSDVIGRRKLIDYTGRFLRNVGKQNHIKGGKDNLMLTQQDSRVRCETTRVTKVLFSLTKDIHFSNFILIEPIL
jgi:hypothetical protein